MKLLRVTNLYPGYVRQFYARRPALKRQPYQVQRAALEHDAYELGGFWGEALGPLGYDVWEVARDAAPAQRAWAREHSARGIASDPDRIVVEQARRFGPDIVWYCHYTEPLLAAIREAVPSTRLVLGGAGAAVEPTFPWKHVDLLVSCAPEAVTLARDRGRRAAVLPHGFDPTVVGRLEPPRPGHGVTFVGQILDREGFHRTRRRVLEEVLESMDVTLFVPRERRTLRTIVRRIVRGSPADELSPKLRRAARDGVYGLEMFQTLRDSEATLNVHIDASSRFASNMRLFETTGAGGCLVTDAKEGLADFFEIDREVVSFASPAECVEKLRWLREHPRDRDAIAAAGQRRTHRDHSYAARARVLDAIVRGALR